MDSTSDFELHLSIVLPNSDEAVEGNGVLDTLQTLDSSLLHDYRSPANLSRSLRLSQ